MNKAFFTLSLCLVAQSTTLSAMEGAPQFHIHNHLNSGGGNSIFGGSIFRYACYATIVGGGYLALKRFDPFAIFRFFGRGIYNTATMPATVQHTAEKIEGAQKNIEELLEKSTSLDAQIKSFNQKINRRLDTIDARLSANEQNMTILMGHFGLQSCAARPIS